MQYEINSTDKLPTNEARQAHLNLFIVAMGVLGLFVMNGGL